MDATTEAILSVFSVFIGQENGDRKEAEQQLTALEMLESYPAKLMSIFMDDHRSIHTRHFAGIILKNYIASHWKESIFSTFKPPEPTDEIKASIRASLLQLLSSPHRFIRSITCQSIVLIVKFDWPQDWPDLLTNLTWLLCPSNLALDAYKYAVHGVMYILSEVTFTLTDLDLPSFASSLIPKLINIFFNREIFGYSTRRRAISVVKDVLYIILYSIDYDLGYALLDTYIRPVLGEIIDEIRNPPALLTQPSFQVEIIKLLSVLCVESPDFIKSYVGSSTNKLIEIVLQVLVRCTDHYVVLNCGDENQNTESNEVDSDGEMLGYDDFIHHLLECLRDLISSTDYKKIVGQTLEAICLQLCRLLQLTNHMISKWKSEVSSFIEDLHDDVVECSIRADAIKLLQTIVTIYPAAPAVVSEKIQEMFMLAENAHRNGDIAWWKLMESSLYAYGSLAVGLINEKQLTHKYPTSNHNLITITPDLVVTHYLEPSIKENDCPFLQASVLRCLTQLFHRGLLNEIHAHRLLSLLADSISNNQSTVMRLSAIYCLSITKPRDFIKLLHKEDNVPFTASYTNVIAEHVPFLINTLLECLSTLDEAVLDSGLCGLYNLLRIDEQNYTRTIINQVMPIIVELFKTCHSVANKFSSFLRVVRVLYVSDDSKPSAIEKAFTPILLNYLENQDKFDSGRDESALRVVHVFVKSRKSECSPFLIQRIFPTVVHIAITTTDAVVISVCCGILRYYLANSLTQLLEWHDDEGNNGVGYILHVTSRLLDPSNPVNWAIDAGKLVCSILLRLDVNQLGENMDLLLRGVVARLCTLNNKFQISRSPRNMLTDTIAAANALQHAKESLLFVIILLFHLQVKMAVDFLSSVPDLSGQPMLKEILCYWCRYHSFYESEHQVKISTIALTSLLLHTIITKDDRILRLTVEQHFGPSTEEPAEKNCPDASSIDIPIVVKMYQALLYSLRGILRKESDVQEEQDVDDCDDDGGDDDHDDGDDDEDGEEMDYCDENDRSSPLLENNCNIKSTPACINSPIVRSDAEQQQLRQFYTDDLFNETDDEEGSIDDPIYSNDPVMEINVKEYLVRFIGEFSEQATYNEFSRHHTCLEHDMLQKLGLL